MLFLLQIFFFFFFNDTATTEIYTLSLHDALPIWRRRCHPGQYVSERRGVRQGRGRQSYGLQLVHDRADRFPERVPGRHRRGEQHPELLGGISVGRLVCAKLPGRQRHVEGEHPGHQVRARGGHRPQLRDAVAALQPVHAHALERLRHPSGDVQRVRCGRPSPGRHPARSAVQRGDRPAGQGPGRKPAGVHYQHRGSHAGHRRRRPSALQVAGRSETRGPEQRQRLRLVPPGRDLSDQGGGDERADSGGCQCPGAAESAARPSQRNRCAGARGTHYSRPPPPRPPVRAQRRSEAAPGSDPARQVHAPVGVQAGKPSVPHAAADSAGAAGREPIVDAESRVLSAAGGSKKVVKVVKGVEVAVGAQHAAPLRFLAPLQLLMSAVCLVPACSGAAGSAAAPAAGGLLFTLLPSSYTGVRFENRLTETNDLNVFTYRNFYNGGGVAIGDLNGDGLPEIVLSSNQGGTRLYLNEGKFRFRDVTDEAGLRNKDGSWTTGVTLADVNGDGRLDIYVCKAGKVQGALRANELWINQGLNAHGVPTFVEAAAAYGIADTGYSTQAVFFDYDRDGDLDLLVINNSPRPVSSMPLENTRGLRDPLGGDRLYRNEGGHFVDVSAAAGIYGSEIGLGLGVVVSDVNRDGWPDIYVADDFFERDYLYLNKGDRTFVERLEQEMPSISLSSMGLDIPDVNNDGWPDIYVGDTLPETEHRLN